MGLSDTATALARDLAASIRKQNSDVVEMFGECPRAESEPKPYAPFQKALAQHFEIELLGPREDHTEEVDHALGEVFQSILPFAGVLFPASTAGTSQASSKDDIAASIAWTLERIAKRKSIILLIDDAQWIDQSSQALLQHLIARFPAGGTVPIAIVVASHDDGVFDRLGLPSDNRRHVDFPSADEQTLILSHGIGLTTKTAREIVDRVGGLPVEQGGLFWLLQVVQSLARAEALVQTTEGIMLRDGKWPVNASIPNEMRDVLAEQLRVNPHYRLIIQCALCACDGREFSATLVAQALDKRRLELLVDLDRIDRETSILYDDRQRDDIFAFQSSFMLDVVRQELQINHAADADELPQIAREHHARLGRILEESLPQNRQYLYQVANHYYMAGSAYAERGLKYCLESANAACGLLNFNTADFFLQRAETCARTLGATSSVEAERLYVQCKRAHVTGQYEDHQQAAKAGVRYLKKHTECPTRLLLAIAQVRYDAGKSSGDPDWFDRSLKLGFRLVENADTPFDEASGRHFIGISLPVDQPDERVSQLRLALKTIETALDNRESLELQGRILGALAAELSHRSESEQREAAKLYKQRLKLIEKHKIGDLRGQAMTHGGLGRLALFGEPKDLKAARFHFRRDLELSEAIDDKQGQIQMHSLLGACDLEQGKIESALSHYQQSWRIAHNPINRFFAGAGLLRCYVSLQKRSAFEEILDALLALARDQGVPAICEQELNAALFGVPTDWHDMKVEELHDILHPPSPTSSKQESAQ